MRLHGFINPSCRLLATVRIEIVLGELLRPGARRPARDREGSGAMIYTGSDRVPPLAPPQKGGGFPRYSPIVLLSLRHLHESVAALTGEDAIVRIGDLLGCRYADQLPVLHPRFVIAVHLLNK